MRAAATRLAAWLFAHTPLLPNGWAPRRITLGGEAFALTPHGQPDPIFDHSADGLFLLELAVALTAAGLADYRAQAEALGDAFVAGGSAAAGGFWGSINHDTYDDHESVAYSCAFRILRRAADVLDRPDWREFAYRAALPALAGFRMAEDRNGVATTGLLWMEESWDTAYLWENAEAAQAYLEAWAETGDEAHREVALGILRCHRQPPLRRPGFSHRRRGLEQPRQPAAPHRSGALRRHPIHRAAAQQPALPGADSLLFREGRLSTSGRHG